MVEEKHKVHITYVISWIDKASEFEWVVEYLDKARFDLSFILLNNEDSLMEEFLRQKNVPYKRITYRSKHDAPSAIYRTYKTLRKWKPDIVNAHLLEGSIIGMLAAKLAGIKIPISTRHHATWHREYFPSAQKYDKLVNSISKKIIAVSPVVERILTEQENVKKEKIEVINHGLNLKYFDNVEPDRVSELGRKYNPSNKSPVIGVISRFVDYKGIPYIVDAFKKLLKDQPNALLILANASGNQYDLIIDYLQKLPEESYLTIKFEADVPALYRLFDVFIHTPINWHSEAFGLTYIESLASGIPSIFTKSGAANDFARHLDNCYVVEYKNSDQIVEGIKYYLENPEVTKRIVENGKKKVKQKYTIEKKIAALERFYLSL